MKVAEGDLHREPHAGGPSPEHRLRHVDERTQLVAGGVATVLLPEPLASRPVSLRPHAGQAGDRIDGAEIILDRAEDAPAREGLEARLPREVEAVHGIDETEIPLLDEVFDLDLAGQPGVYAGGDRPDVAPHVVRDQPIAGGERAGGLVALPRILDLRGDRSGDGGRGCVGDWRTALRSHAKRNGHRVDP